MKKFAAIYKFHLKENLKSKAFKISTAIIFVAILAFFAYSNWANQNDSGNKDTIAVINKTESNINVNALNKTLDETKLGSAQKDEEEKFRKRWKKVTWMDCCLSASKKGSRP